MRAATDAGLGKTTLLDHAEWIKDNHRQLSPEMVDILMGAVARLSGMEDSQRLKDMAKHLLVAWANPVRRMATEERSWSMKTIGVLVAHNTLSAEDLGALGRLKVKALLRDAEHYCQDNEQDPNVPVLRAASTRAALMTLARKSKRSHKDPAKRTI